MKGYCEEAVNGKDYRLFMKIFCKKSCGHCGTEEPATEEPYTDSDSDSDSDTDSDSDSDLDSDSESESEGQPKWETKDNGDRAMVSEVPNDYAESGFRTLKMNHKPVRKGKQRLNKNEKQRQKGQKKWRRQKQTRSNKKETLDYAWMSREVNEKDQQREIILRIFKSQRGQQQPLSKGLFQSLIANIESSVFDNVLKDGASTDNILWHKWNRGHGGHGIIAVADDVTAKYMKQLIEGNSIFLQFLLPSLIIYLLMQ